MQITIAIAKAGRSINVDTDKLIDVDANATVMTSDATFDGLSPAEMFAWLLERSPKLAYVVNYGLTQSLNDAHANAKSDNADIIMSHVEKRLSRIYDGSVQVRGSGGRKGDPIEREATRRAEAKWNKLGDGARNAAIGKARGAYTQFADSDDETIAAALIAAMAKTPEIVEAARKEVESRRAAKQAADAIQFDVTSLLGESNVDEDDAE